MLFLYLIGQDGEQQSPVRIRGGKERRKEGERGGEGKISVRVIGKYDE